MTETNLQIAELLLRLFAGVLFLFQGYDKLFKVKMSNVIETFLPDAKQNNIPKPLVVIVAYFTSFAELIGGLLLLFGFMTNYALYVLSVDLLLVAFSFSFVQAMWDLKFVFPRLAIVTTLLLLPENSRKFCLDYFLSLN